jgi:hypothetical protein
VEKNLLHISLQEDSGGASIESEIFIYFLFFFFFNISIYLTLFFFLLFSNQYHMAARSIQRTFRGKSLLFLLRLFVMRVRNASLVLQRFCRSMQSGHAERSAAELQKAARDKRAKHEYQKRERYRQSRMSLKKKEERELVCAIPVLFLFFFYNVIFFFKSFFHYFHYLYYIHYLFSPVSIYFHYFQI